MAKRAASCPADDGVGQGADAVGIGGGDGGDSCAVLGPRERRTRSAAIGGDGRSQVVGIGDGDGDRLVVGQGAVGDAHDHVVDIVGPRIGRGLEVWRGDEGEHAGRGVDREAGGIGAADDAVGEHRAGIGIGGGHGRHGGAVLGERQGGTRPAAIGADDGGELVEVGEGDGNRMIIGADTVGDAHDHVVDISAPASAGASKSGGGDEGEHAGRGVDGEAGGIGPADDGVGQGADAVGIGGGHGGHSCAVSARVSAALAPPPSRRMTGARGCSIP